MKDFIQANFSEFILTVVIVCAVIVLLFAIHWHDETTSAWARGLITSVVLALAATLNTMKQPRPNGSVSAESHAEGNGK